jgi:2-polyprenyl-3-methyl-5-hydroxy-6-metoxy-1,4-benzoquinol methylase
MNDDTQTKRFWASYSEDHFWRLNDKSKVKDSAPYYARLFDSLLPSDRAARIIDIGCGGGHFLYYLKAKGYSNLEGVDMAPGLVDFVREQIWPNVHNGDALEYLKKNADKYDAIVANDFIEHLPKNAIIQFLFCALAALRPGGMLLLKTPNMSNLFASRHRYVDFTHEVGFTEYSALRPGRMLLLKTPNMSNLFASRHRYVDFTHEVGFTEYSLHEVCAAAGFQDIRILSEFHAGGEPKIYRWMGKLYTLLGEQSPQVLTTNLIATARRPH